MLKWLNLSSSQPRIPKLMDHAVNQAGAGQSSNPCFPNCLCRTNLDTRCFFVCLFALFCKQYYFKMNQILSPKYPYPWHLAHVCKHKESVKPTITLLQAPEPQSQACVRNPTGTVVWNAIHSLIQLSSLKAEGPYPIKNNRKSTIAINLKLWLLQFLIFHEQLVVCKKHTTFSLKKQIKINK